MHLQHKLTHQYDYKETILKLQNMQAENGLQQVVIVILLGNDK